MLYFLNDYLRFKALVSLPLTGDQKPSHFMNRIPALLRDDYKPNFILCGFFLCCLSIKVRSHPLQEKILDSCALALKTDELFKSRISSPVNLLAGQLKDVEVNAVATRTPPSPSAKISPTPTPTPSSRSPYSPRLCWYHKKHGDKAQNFKKPCSE